MPLTNTQRDSMARVLRGASDELVSAPLWEAPWYYVPSILSERKRRNILQHDPEPIGDPEYH